MFGFVTIVELVLNVNPKGWQAAVSTYFYASCYTWWFLAEPSKCAAVEKPLTQIRKQR